MITLENISVGYGSRVLLQDASCTIGAGRLVALLGRNGAGKSSLLRVMAGLDKPLAGEVKVRGRALAAMPAAERARALAFVTTARVRVASLRCADVVGMGRAPYTDWMGRLGKADREAVGRALRLVGMEDYAGRTLESMSDGECQRVMIARALAQDAPILLLDEPTSFLDLPNRYELGLLLRRLAHEQGKCVVFSTHELDIALGVCDELALIDTPRLRYGSTRAMEASGHVERLFSTGTVKFDASTGRVIF